MVSSLLASGRAALRSARRRAAGRPAAWADRSLDRRGGAPAPADWLIQYGLNRDNVDAVHVGGCWAAKKSGRSRAATREQALDALRNRVPPCVHCQPDTALGIGD
ncbi:DUF6233 domain-containing protein [Streptomyces sp. Ru62]|uniref:DUF6233 domain-containing protein n=1 Tax=Streptomyces sp. Ru62 TaxID=2080745 RepID=UPI0027E4F1F7|nr:DUF6233 domain-containing protein [Streptomyces sp. Ru62]